MLFMAKRGAFTGGTDRDQPVALVADTVEYNNTTGELIASGNVEVYYGEELENVDIQQLLANYIANCQQAHGDVKFVFRSAGVPVHAMVSGNWLWWNMLIGGMLTATLLTLLVLPVVYTWMERDDRAPADPHADAFAGDGQAGHVPTVHPTSA